MNNEWHLYDMNLYRDSFQNYKVYQIPKVLNSWQPDMFQMLKYEGKNI